MKIRKIHTDNYQRLQTLNIIQLDFTLRTHAKSISSGYMDLIIEERTHLDQFLSPETKGYSLAHYFVQNGDMCSDPFMQIHINNENQWVAAHSFQQDLPPFHSEVFPEPKMYKPALEKELNQFLSDWLQNLIDQDHGKHWE
ncbi:hypothetical protein [uncultured Shewanella sp.]|uniref:DUF6908 domain-containing protein n=1 Tax=uncultured Shewanella sp. TaxID=173975 RepID=UPI00260BFE4E|nr:hypothetical protein [uncultured Shewanella sp.]